MPVGADSDGRDRVLYRLAAELTSSLDLDEVLGRVMDRVIDLMQASRGSIVLVDDRRRLRVRAARGDADDAPAGEFAGSRSVVEEVVATGRAVLTTDATIDERFRAQESVIMQNLRSVIAVPLNVRARTIGAVYVDNPFRSGMFRDEDREFLQAIADLAAIAIDNALTFAHAEHLRRTFERYVNKTVTDWVLDDPDRDRPFIPGARLTVTMLASDIAGFSRLSQQMEAEAVVEFLNGYFSRMVDIVLEHGGNVDKFQGDGLLAAFGAPVPMTDSADRAVAAATAMSLEMVAINGERSASGLLPIEVGIGLDTGPVVAGNLGSERRMEYTLIGVPVNNAAFLSKIRPPGVLLSSATHRALSRPVAAVQRPPMFLKGAGEAAQVWALHR